MAATVLHIDPRTPASHVLQQAAAALKAGKIVAFPTETVYGLGVNAEEEQAVERLHTLKQRPPGQPFAYHLGDYNQIERFLDPLPAPGRRLASRYWPGPIMQVFPGVGEQGLGLRVVGDKTAQQLLNLTDFPVVATSANLHTDPPAVSGVEVRQRLADVADVIVDAGPTQFREASTVVSIASRALKILREGVISPGSLIQNARESIAFVCTGNLCRSPMAVGLFRKLLAEDADHLLGRGWVPATLVDSGGIEASIGEPITSEALDIMREHEAASFVEHHRAKPFQREELDQLDRIYVMTHQQLRTVRAWDRHIAPKVHLLDPSGKDIPDPYTKGIETYRRVSYQILRALKERFFDA